MLTPSRRPALVLATVGLVLLAACSATPSGEGPPPAADAPAPATGPAGNAVGTTPAPPLDSAVEEIADDRTLPGRGNPTIDVRHYDLDLDWDPEAETLTGEATLEIRAAEALGGAEHPTIDLDLQPFTIESVTVDGRPAEATTGSDKLRIASPAVAVDDVFTVVVRYSGDPQPVATRALGGVSVGWLQGNRSSIVLAEPDGAHSWYPLNDHPLDKATYSFEISVPAPLWAVANGRLEQVADSGGTRTFHWVMDAPMAGYLASVVTGELEPRGEGTEDGVEYSSYVPVGDDVAVDAIPRVVGRLVDKLGPFPFQTYGAVIYDPAFIEDEDSTTRSFISQVALEVQGRSLYARVAFEPSVIIHETAHQWFGDSVSVTDWSDDIWWVEGFATFAEDAFASDGPPARSLERARDRYESRWSRCQGTAVDGLDAADLFSGPSYECGSLVYYALWNEVGDDELWTILRTFQERHRHGNATTQDLIDTASDVAGRDLEPFLRRWLGGDRPALP